MKRLQRNFMPFLFLLALFSLPILLFWPSEPGSDNSKDDSLVVQFESNTDPQKMNQIMAKDLSLTTSLFVNQLSALFKKWKDLDFGAVVWQEKFKEELNNHQHVHALALANEDKIETYYGDISEAKILTLLSNNRDAQVIYSDPYQESDRLLMLVAHRKDDQYWLVGEIDLDFVKTYVKDLASIADAQGNMFISPENEVEVKLDGSGKNVHVAKEKVPELNWEISVQHKVSKKKVKDYVDGQAVVRFKDHVYIEEWLKQHPEIKVYQHNELHYVLAHDKLSTPEFISLLRKEGVIKSAEPNYHFTKQNDESLMLIPNDEFFYPYQWNLRQIGVESGWALATDAERIMIAVLDTGIDTEHEDLREKIVEGYNSFDGSNDVQDDHGHGTHVAGIAAAITNNITGIAGVSWYNYILPVKVLDKDGAGSLFEVANGIKWATDQGAKVINLSLGDAQESDILYEAIRYAFDHDVVLIAAAGNDNVAQPMFPAAYEEVLAVAAVNQMQDKASFSNYGPHIDVTAPGEHIPSTFLNNHYVFMSGTSMAAPHVAGLAGLIRAHKPELSNVEVMELIRKTADDLGPKGFDEYFGHGQINLNTSLKAIEQQDYASQHYQPAQQILSDWFFRWRSAIKEKWRRME